MSGNKVSWSWRHAFAKSELPSTTKLVLHTIGLFMNETGSGSYPTVKQIMELSTLSNKAVIKHIKIAIEEGWLRSKVHGFRGQKWKNHEYEAHWPNENGDGKAGEPQATLDDKVVNLSPVAGEPQGEKVVNEVHSIVPNNIPSTITPVVPKGKGSRISADWKPNDNGYQLATSLGVNPNTELEIFIDYWLAVSGSKGVKLDWDATWRNWVRRARPSTQNKKSQSEIMVEAFARA